MVLDRAISWGTAHAPIPTLQAPGTLDLEALCIIEGSRVWKVNIDLLVLECAGGALHECCALAVRAALACTAVQRTEVVRDESGEVVDFDLVEDETDPVDVSRLPVLVSLTQIGDSHLVDATAEEEACMTGRLLVAINGMDNPCSLTKSGRAGVKPAALVEALRLAQRTGSALIKQLEEQLSALRSGNFVGVTS